MSVPSADSVIEAKPASDNDSNSVRLALLVTNESARKWLIVGVYVPILSAIIGMASAVACAEIRAGSNSAGQESDQTIACRQYEEYVIGPLIEHDAQLAKILIESGSAIDHRCGLGGP
jgi:hypothetical protein